ncbi:MAG: hypothetical protein GQ574_24575 [Crocinitomix sp.]|nr:hypothetical protein [Crocinitomix sp.]
MKLQLKKQEIAALSSDEMKNVQGGGVGWSNFRTGNCSYSDKMPDNYLSCDEFNEDGTRTTVTVGCVSK